MNNFNGILEEYEKIAVDCFDGESLKATAFFLSHCHTDHMKGIANTSFFDRLKCCSDIKLYCSKVTSDLLVGDEKFQHLKPFMIILDVQEPHTINIPGRIPDDETEQVLVTLLPAGHCPGSVMFLFEGRGGTVLYTGDFRLTKEDLLKMNVCGIERLDKVYIDTTFCTLDAMQLPQRRQSRDALFEILDPWLAEGPNHVVCLSCPAQFGCEYLFVELNKRYNMKVHVYQKKMWKYAAIPEIMDSVTLSSKSTRLHACSYKVPKTAADGKEIPVYGNWLPCERYQKRKRRNILFIRLSTMWFTSNNNSSDGLLHCYSDNSYRVCYSMHSSCEELSNFVHHFKPKSLHPLVIPLGSTLEKVHQLLQLDPEQLSSLESLTEKKFGSLKNETLLATRIGSTESDLIFTADSQLRSPESKRAKMDSPPKEQTRESPAWKSSSRSISDVSHFQEFDFSPVKLSISQPETCATPHSDIPKWSFVISPDKELSSSQETSCSFSQSPRKLVHDVQTSSSCVADVTPSKESVCSASSSQESHGSGYKSLGGCSRNSPGDQDELKTSQQMLVETSTKSHARVDLMSRLEQRERCAGDILTLELSSSMVEVIDLTADDMKIPNERNENSVDWDSTPDLDEILKTEKLYFEQK